MAVQGWELSGVPVAIPGQQDTQSSATAAAPA
jgi:hypothetical protein